MPCGVLPRPTPRSSSSFCTAGPTAGPAATAQLMMINGGRTPALPPVSPGRDRTVTCRIRANCASPPPSSSSEGARIENVFLGSVQVRDTQVERELLGLNGIRPPWRLRSSTRWKANTSPSVWSVVQPSPSDHRGSGWFTAPRQATGRTGKGQRHRHSPAPHCRSAIMKGSAARKLQEPQAPVTSASRFPKIHNSNSQHPDRHR